ncbi:hypothetical protein [Paenibacillus sp. CF384]|uniref:hypothetical protein n=1 Tax=Paenibacillus sp. CF384 TaxID=1884382 RepID=UPI000895CFE9|nr:hypothetical protein [Paenibacillus sp. CF384]SDX46226.1 hypothetical protein SAMN05518855_1014109 [Paenibacillus sp. CF384]
MLKRSIVLLLSLLIVLCAGTAAHAQTNTTTAANPVMLTLDEQLQPGQFSVTFSRPISLKHLEANFTIPNKKIKWYTEQYGGYNKSYYGVIDNAAKGLGYPVKLGKGLDRAKAVDLSLLWRSDYIDGELGFYLEIGTFELTSTIKTSAEQFKKYIKANDALVNVEPASENDGFHWIITIPHAKPSVDYTITFAKPIIITNTVYNWRPIPVQITDANSDLTAGTIQLSLHMDADRELSLRDFIITATRNDKLIKLQNVTYKAGILSFAPIADLMPEDKLSIQILGNASSSVYGTIKVTNT